MPPFPDALRSWYRAYVEAGGRRQVRVEFREAPPERRGRAASIQVEGTLAVGQLTVWESGECDVEAVATRGGPTILLRSRTLDSPERVAAVADDLVDHVADFSGT